MQNQTIEINQDLLNPKSARLQGPHQTSFECVKLLTHIGRNADNDLPLNDPFVSSYHCVIEKKNGSFTIRDLDSKNGIKVNGIKVKEANLTHNMQIVIGETPFTFNISSSNSEFVDPVLRSKNRSWSMQLLTLKPLSQTALPVFLQGESGCGKEVLARLIHNLSSRADKPFVSVNCSALSESLVESELFGHVKGSFTGATHDRKGAFEAARGGTLFLDEIGDLPMTLQPKLLRALENKEIKPVGSDQVIATDVRIITATHKNLQRLVAQELFRSDLYFRIHVVKIAIPALRDRMEDFEDLLYGFCRDFKMRFSVEAIAELKKFTWPGNIRELKNLISRASALFPETYILPEHLAHLVEPPFEELPIQRPPTVPLLKDMEKEMIRMRLIANNGNQRQTARELGIPKSTLHDRIKSYGIKI